MTGRSVWVLIALLFSCICLAEDVTDLQANVNSLEVTPLLLASIEGLKNALLSKQESALQDPDQPPSWSGPFIASLGAMENELNISKWFFPKGSPNNARRLEDSEEEMKHLGMAHDLTIKSIVNSNNQPAVKAAMMEATGNIFDAIAYTVNPSLSKNADQFLSPTSIPCVCAPCWWPSQLLLEGQQKCQCQTDKPCKLIYPSSSEYVHLAEMYAETLNAIAGASLKNKNALIQSIELVFDLVATGARSPSGAAVAEVGSGLEEKLELTDLYRKTKDAIEDSSLPASLLDNLKEAITNAFNKAAKAVSKPQEPDAATNPKESARCWPRWPDWMITPQQAYNRRMHPGPCDY